jgi:hypothetical protein
VARSSTSFSTFWNVDYKRLKEAERSSTCRGVVAELPASISGPNFRVAEYIDNQGKKRPMIEFSEDVLPVIGRHGSDATTSSVSDHMATSIACLKFSQ